MCLVWNQGRSRRIPGQIYNPRFFVFANLLCTANCSLHVRYTMIGWLTFTRELAVVLAAGFVPTHDTFNVLVLVGALWGTPRLGAGCLRTRGGTLLEVPTSQPSRTTSAAAPTRVREPSDILCCCGGAGSCARTQARVADVAQHHGAAGARVPPGGRRGRHQRHAARKPELQRGDVGGLTARPEEPRRRRTQHPGTHGEGVVRNNNGIWSGGVWPPLMFPLIVILILLLVLFLDVLFFFAVFTFRSCLLLFTMTLRQKTWQLSLHNVLTSHIGRSHHSQKSHTITTRTLVHPVRRARSATWLYTKSPLTARSTWRAEQATRRYEQLQHSTASAGSRPTALCWACLNPDTRPLRPLLPPLALTAICFRPAGASLLP